MLESNRFCPGNGLGKGFADAVSMSLTRLIVHLMFLGLFLSSSTKAEESRTLSLGEQASLAVDPGTRFSVGNPGVIQVKVAPLEGGRSLLLVRGKSQGYSDLILLAGNGARTTLSFRVVSKKQGALATDGKRLLSAPKGVHLQATGDGWVMRGKVKSLEDWNVIQALRIQGKGKIQSLLRLHPMERVRAESEIRKILSAAGIEGVEVESVGNTLVLRGEAETVGEKEFAEEISRQIVMDLRSEIRVPIEKGGRLRFRAKILELMKGSARSLGLQWQEGVPGALQLGMNGIKSSVAIEAALRILEKSGKARLLSQPELLLNERGIAELKVGGEIPVQSKSKNSSSIQWKPYGLSLRLELPGISRGIARAKITVEISSLDHANGFEGVPALRMSKMNTEVDMEVGKAILLSGLMEEKESKSGAGVPLLGDLPLFGSLFRSNDTQRSRSELVILIEALK